MPKYAIVVTSEHGEANPGGQARLLHALSAAKKFKDAGFEVKVFFHGIGVGWLAAFEARYDAFTRNYAPLFDDIRDLIGGACNFCATKRFGAAETVERLGVAVVGPEGGHHTVADLVMDGYEVFSF